MGVEGVWRKLWFVYFASLGLSSLLQEEARSERGGRRRCNIFLGCFCTIKYCIPLPPSPPIFPLGRRDIGFGGLD